MATIQKIAPEVGQNTQDLITLPQLPQVDILITPLINDLVALNKRIVVALDDYHLIHNSYIHNIIQFIIVNRPPLLHFVVITREDPPLQLPRLRAGGVITEIRADRLRFSEAETITFMASTMKLNLVHEVSILLNLITEGWAVGLQLAALSIQGHTPEEIERMMVDISGNNQHIIDYLISEVILNLPEALHDFLRQTAVLDRLCAPLCNAILKRDDSQQLLELLERNNLFIFPLDNQGQWYRYHQLFANSLCLTLNKEEQQLIHQKAARWCKENEYLEEAIDHAIAAADYQEAGNLIYLVAPDMFFSLQITTLLKWLNALPEDLIRTKGEVALSKISVLNCIGQIEAIEPYIVAFENDPQAQIPTLNRIRYYIFRAELANSRGEPDAVEFAKKALDLVKGVDSFRDYVGALNTYGVALRNNGNLTEAIKVFGEIVKLKHKFDSPFVKIYALYYLLVTLELNGQLSEAIRLGQSIPEEMLDPSSPLVKVAYIPLGIFYYKANNLDRALKYLADGMDICRKLSINRLFDVEYALAQVYDAVGDSEKALLTIREIVRRIDFSSQPLAAFNIMAIEAEFFLRKGDLKPALDWAEYWQLTSDDTPNLRKEQSYFTFIRLLLVQERFSEALRLLTYLEESIKSGQRYSRLITVYILEALTYHLSGNESKSRQYLLQALKLAEPESYYRPFFDEGPRIAAILPKVQEIESQFVTKLRKSFTRIQKNSSRPKSDNLSLTAIDGLIEPLSNREIELLQLVAAGLSNREVSRILTVSSNTTKWHLYNIFQKLNVTSRTQAVAKAKELDLI